ncbi:ovochymase-2-like [Chironomus tepperi]|uniref:ovochymase-2-like n=1 Tax=Chironomus tepperi TaxID=113505 RepID=UPI00391EF9DE
MEIKIFLALLFPTLIVTQAPCSNYWQYVRSPGQIEGLLTITPNNGYSEHKLKLTLSVSARLPGSYVGDINLIKDRQSALNDISRGYSIQYRVRFPITSPLPKVVSVVYNNQQICVGQKAYGTAINLEHNLSNNVAPHAVQHTQPNQPIQIESRFQDYSPPIAQNYNQNYHVQNTVRTTIAYRATPTRPPVQAPARVIPPQQQYNKQTYVKQNEYIDSNNQCGIPLQNLPESTGLVINGKPALKGQFPWLAAYYHNGVRENGFICGGSLVSSKAVLTAAHCIHNKHDTPKKAEEAIFYIGKHLINTFANEKDFILAPVTSFVIHPDWNAYSSTYDADIAIALLSRTIQFTNFIRPICLWTYTDNYNDIVNKFGVIAGYGKTENSASTSDKPYWTALPVVDEGTCLRSHNDFTKITSKRTFCVGSRDGRGPCNGDSGGGFIVRQNGRWYLRGIVSSSLFDKELYSCDTNNFAVFTDVAAYKDWIQAYIYILLRELYVYQLVAEVEVGSNFMKKEILIKICFFTLVFAQNPCSNYWQYVRSQNQIQGLLSFTHNQRSTEHHLKIILSVGATLPNSYVGDVSLIKDKIGAYQDIVNQFPLQYRVRFPVQAPLPKLEAVYYNNKILCIGKKEVAAIITTITLDHTIHTKPLSPTMATTENYKTTQYIPIYQSTPKYTQATQPPLPPEQLRISSVDPSVYTNTLPKTLDSNRQCGVPQVKLEEHSGLIINGKAVKKGQFPWMVSYFHNGGEINAFICGGTLISAKSVLTAAHCVHEKGNLPRNSDEALFYIGKNMIKYYGEEKDFVIAAASKFIVHPNWNASKDSLSFDGDIAMVILSRTTPITSSIQPICLWTATDNYNDIIGQSGVIAGFGKTEFSNTSSDIPYWVPVTAIDEGTCLRSHDGFTKITSRRTFCIGGSDRRGPCNGDSGGGFVIKSNGKWYLRGIISASFYDQELRTCDTNNYSVCTDVVAFHSWIVQNMI